MYMNIFRFHRKAYRISQMAADFVTVVLSFAGVVHLVSSVLFFFYHYLIKSKNEVIHTKLYQHEILLKIFFIFWAEFIV